MLVLAPVELKRISQDSLSAIEVQQVEDDAATIVWVPRGVRRKRRLLLAVSMGLFLAGCATGVQVLESRPETVSQSSTLSAHLDGVPQHAQGNVRGASLGFVVESRGRSSVEEAFGVRPGSLGPERGLANGCPAGMVPVEGFCVDKFEASLMEVLPDGSERPFSPFLVSTGHHVRAVSLPGVFPQGYISGDEASRACKVSGKRLCSPKEWKRACMGPSKKRYGYSDKVESRRCNDHGKSPMGILHGQLPPDSNLWSQPYMNNPQLNQLSGTLARSGEHDGCTNEYGVYDMVGNLHEWVADPKGTFQGGYYQDTKLNGEGCNYATTAHESWYHDYSTGFRCCADLEF